MLDDAGNRAVVISGDTVVDLDPGGHLIALVRQHASASIKPSNPAPATKPAPGSAFGTLRAGLEAARDAEAKQRVAQAISAGNPWQAGRLNRTAQAIITKGDPERAARMKAEAGFVQPNSFRWRK